jgi:phosphoglycolate phosphatase
LGPFGDILPGGRYAWPGWVGREHGRRSQELPDSTNMSFRAVIFDLDGTLLDTLDDIANAANKVLADRGFPVHPVPRYREFVGEGVLRLIRRVLPDQNEDDQTVQDCLEAYRHEYARTWNVQTRPYPGVTEMLDGLTARGLRMAVLSNKPDAFTQLCVRQLLPRWNFEVVLGASEAFPPKPDPASALEIARRLEVSAAECLYAGDSGVDMETARGAGMFAVGVLWGFRGAAELTESGAQVLIEQPAQIVDLLRKSGGAGQAPQAMG